MSPKSKRLFGHLSVSYYSTTFFISKSSLFQNFLQLIHKGVYILELSVYGSKTHICYRIHLFQLVHYKLTDHITGNLFVFSAEDIVLYFIHQSGDLLGADGTFVTCTQYACLHLRPIISLPVVILLDNDQGNGLYLLIGGKSLAALITDTAAADGIVLLCRSGINYSGILMITIRTLHVYSCLP